MLEEPMVDSGDTDDDDDPIHIFCPCSEMVSMCGAYVGDEPEIEEFSEDELCEECSTVDACPRCGNDMTAWRS